MKNKKGAVVSGLASILLYLGFVLLIIIFYFVFGLTQGDTEVKILGEIQDAGTNYQILNYLRMPVTYEREDGIKITENMADVITKYYLFQDSDKQASYYAVIQEKTKEIFNEKYPNLRFRIKISQKEFAKKSIEMPAVLAEGQTTNNLKEENIFVKSWTVACVNLPNPQRDAPIKIEFSFLNNAADGKQRSEFESLKKSKFYC